jgi:hypothetical protein
MCVLAGILLALPHCRETKLGRRALCLVPPSCKKGVEIKGGSLEHEPDATGFRANVADVNRYLTGERRVGY